MTVSWSINLPPVSTVLCHCHFWMLCDNLILPLLRAWVLFLPTQPYWGSCDALVLLCNVLHMASGRGSKLRVEWCFCSTWIIPEESKLVHGSLKQGCQDVRGGPKPAHPTRQLLPARHPSTNNLLWEEVSVCSARVYSVYLILSESYSKLLYKE